jgi:hypothetical protein
LEGIRRERELIIAEKIPNECVRRYLASGAPIGFVLGKYKFSWTPFSRNGLFSTPIGREYR